MGKIAYIQCGNINQYIGLEEALIHYQKVRPAKKENVGPYFQEFDIGAQRANCGFNSLDLSEAVTTLETEIAGVRVRMYRSAHTLGQLPCIFFIHGGGFVAGTLNGMENPCKRLAQQSESCVIAIDYGLSPEYPFPKAIIQCMDVIYKVYELADQYLVNSSYLALAGDSAGANIAMAVAQKDAQHKQLLSYLMLYYPVIDQRIETKNYFSFDFYGNFQNTYTHTCISSLLDCEQMFHTCYLQGHDAEDPLASMMFIDKQLSMPAMYIITAEFDYLRISEELFFEAYSTVFDIEMVCYRGVNHGFLEKLGVFPQADDSLHRMAQAWANRRKELNRHQ